MNLFPPSNVSPKNTLSPHVNKLKEMLKSSHSESPKLFESDELLPSTPLSLLQTRSKKFKKTFKQFLAGSIDSKQLMNMKNFQSGEPKEQKFGFIRSEKSSISELAQCQSPHGLQQKNPSPFGTQIAQIIQKPLITTQKRGRFFDLSLQIQKDKQAQARLLKTRLRWGKLRNVIEQNIKVRRRIFNETAQQSKILSTLESGLVKSSEDFNLNLIFHKLHTMTVLQEKKTSIVQSKLLSPRQYQFLLSMQFKENSDLYVLTHLQSLSQQQKCNSTKDQVLKLYLNKANIYEKWLNQQNKRKVLKWNNSHLGKPMQRIINPYQKTQDLMKLKNELMVNVNHIEAIEKIPQQFKPYNFKKYSNEIKHNRLLSNPTSLHNYDDDSQDNISNASITEAVLEQLYSETYSLTQKISKGRGSTFQRKMRDYFKLEEVRTQTLRVNKSKLLK